MEIINVTQTAHDAALAGRPLDKRMELGPEAARERDMAHVSRDALLLTEALRGAQNAPDVRAARVEALRASLENGTYRPDSMRIAEALVAEEPGLFKI